MTNATLCLQIRFAPSLQALVEATLYEHGISSFQEGEFVENTSGLDHKKESEDAHAPMLLQCFFDSTEELALLQGALQERFGSKVSLQATEFADQNWRERWKEFAQPIEIGTSLLLHASFHSIDPKPGQLAIEIDPGMAFGSGSHPTTKLCLGLIAECFSDLSSAPSTVLDVGCGSGILSVAADLFGATQVMGVDIDPAAIEASAENARKNEAWNCQFSSNTLEELDGSFDLVVANILSSTLRLLWEEILRHCRPGGTIILSGLLAEEQSVFFETLDLETSGCAIEKTCHEDSWLAVQLQRSLN